MEKFTLFKEASSLGISVSSYNCNSMYLVIKYHILIQISCLIFGSAVIFYKSPRAVIKKKSTAKYLA